MTEHGEKIGAGAEGEPAFLTTKEVAALLRVRERKVYEMASAGEIPCRKVTGKLLFPKSEIDAWLGAGAVKPAAASFPAPSSVAPKSAGVIVGSHDPLLVWALGACDCAAPTLFSGSLDGLERLARGEAMAAALHIFDAPSGGWNIPAIEARGLEDRFALLAFARRRQGVIHRPGGRAPSDLRALTDCKIMLRQKGSGGRLLFESLLAAEGLALDALETAQEEARSESELAEAIADGRADAALGLEAMARRYGLGFTPLIEERFDLLVERKAFFDPPLQRLLAFLRGDAASRESFAERAASQAGYDVSEIGQVRWNGAR